MTPSLLPSPPAHALDQLTAVERARVDDADHPLTLGQVLTSAHGLGRVLAPGLDAARWCQAEGPVRRHGVIVGDWVLVDSAADPPLLVRRLDARTVLRRRDPEGGSQPVAANLDVALICTALGHELSVRRVERWCVLCAEAGIQAVVVVTKADGDVEVGPALEALSVLQGVPVLPVSGLERRGLDAVREVLPAGALGALLGSSGVGKSTLINALLQTEAQATGAVRETDDRGRHTTTARHLFGLPWGAFLIDNPGTREVGVLDEDGILEAFPEIDALTAACRWRDCTHRGDDGCAIEAARAAGELDAARHAAWQRLRAEAAESAARAARLEAARERRLRGRGRRGGKPKPKRRR